MEQVLLDLLRIKQQSLTANRTSPWTNNTFSFMASCNRNSIGGEWMEKEQLELSTWTCRTVSKALCMRGCGCTNAKVLEARLDEA